MQPFLYTIVIEHNLYSLLNKIINKDKRLFPLVGKIHHWIFYKYLEQINKQIAENIYSQKPYKTLSAFISKNHIYLYTTDTIIGNKLIDTSQNNSLINIQAHNSNLLQLITQSNKLIKEQQTDKKEKISINFVIKDIKLKLIQNILKKYNNETPLNIKIKTPVLISPRFKYNEVTYLINTIFKKSNIFYKELWNQNNVDINNLLQQIKTNPKSFYTINFLKTKQKLFSPLGKQSYTGIYGNLTVKFNKPIYNILFKLGTFTNVGLKSSYGYGYIKVNSEFKSNKNNISEKNKRSTRTNTVFI